MELAIYNTIVALFSIYAIVQIVKGQKKTKKRASQQWITKDQLIAAVHFQMQEVTGDANIKEAEKVVERVLRYLPKDTSKTAEL